MDNLTAKKTKETRQHVLDLKARPLVRAILNLCYELHDVLPHSVNFQHVGHVEWLEIRILDSDLDVVWDVDHIYIKGDMMLLDELQRLHNLLQVAVTNKELPKSFETDNPF